MFQSENEEVSAIRNRRDSNRSCESSTSSYTSATETPLLPSSTTDSENRIIMRTSKEELQTNDMHNRQLSASSYESAKSSISYDSVYQMNGNRIEAAGSVESSMRQNLLKKKTKQREIEENKKHKKQKNKEITDEAEKEHMSKRESHSVSASQHEEDEMTQVQTKTRVQNVKTSAYISLTPPVKHKKEVQDERRVQSARGFSSNELEDEFSNEKYVKNVKKTRKTKEAFVEEVNPQKELQENWPKEKRNKSKTEKKKQKQIIEEEDSDEYVSEVAYRQTGTGSSQRIQKEKDKEKKCKKRRKEKEIILDINDSDGGDSDGIISNSNQIRVSKEKSRRDKKKIVINSEENQDILCNSDAQENVSDVSTNESRKNKKKIKIKKKQKQMLKHEATAEERELSFHEEAVTASVVTASIQSENRERKKKKTDKKIVIQAENENCEKALPGSVNVHMERQSKPKHESEKKEISFHDERATKSLANQERHTSKKSKQTESSEKALTGSKERPVSKEKVETTISKEKNITPNSKPEKVQTTPSKSISPQNNMDNERSSSERELFGFSQRAAVSEDPERAACIRAMENKLDRNLKALIDPSKAEKEPKNKNDGDKKIGKRLQGKFNKEIDEFLAS